MSTNELLKKIELLNEYEAMLEEVKAECESLKDEIKGFMLEQGTEQYECGQYVVRYCSVLSTRLDSTALKKAMPDVYKQYTKQIPSRRFTISA